VKLIFAIFVIIIIAISGSRLSFLNRKSFMGVRNIILTGVEYIFVGIILGHLGLNLLDSDTLLSLEPFIVFGLGWVGFMMGLQLRVQNLRKLPRHYLSITTLSTIATFILMSAGMYFVLRWFLNFQDSVIWLMAMTLGAAASNTAQSALAIVNNNYIFKNKKLMQLIRYISGMDGVYSIIFFGLLLSVYQAIHSKGFEVQHISKMILFSIGIGFVFALTLILLSEAKFTQEEFIVFLLGVILMACGFAFKNNFSPLFIGLIIGIMYANFCRYRLRAMSIVIQSEKSIYIILLIMLGASWDFSFNKVLIIGLIFVVLRLIAKIVSAYASISFFKTDFKVPTFLGLSLLSEGGLAIAIIINFELIFPEIANILITIIIISAILNEFFSPSLILSQFEKKEFDVKKKTIPNAKDEKI